MTNETSKLDIKIFDEKDSQPFKEADLTSKRVYEIHDETLRTPIEKAEVFEKLLNTPNECELWIVPVTEETASIMKSITEEKTNALFGMLSSIKDKMQRDRTFLVLGPDCSSDMTDQVKELGYTLSECTPEQLEEVKVEY
ncbi:hypothetical protein JOC78_002390 [Bacillus ectoiniformans]|uniref:hypothetical protein n=1 Tax=Bacillus ectoiniformans TaxID=1494429 RepID=UPI0019580721|nr:hypothetical protein [Bacillus ectoiniformans]MBM7649437.1 hypothetical protein [Bacillus ectoiniformans]